MAGISNANPDQIRLANAILGQRLASVQNQFLPAFRSSEPELHLCTELGIAFLPWSPLGAWEVPGPRRTPSAVRGGGPGPRRQPAAGPVWHGCWPNHRAWCRFPAPAARESIRDSAAAARPRPLGGGGRAPRRRPVTWCVLNLTSRGHDSQRVVVNRRLNVLMFFDETSIRGREHAMRRISGRNPQVVVAALAITLSNPATPAPAVGAGPGRRRRCRRRSMPSSLQVVAHEDDDCSS